MTKNILNATALTVLVTALSIVPALARGNDLTIKDGFGEEIQVQNGFFGHKTKVVKDRLGDGYAQKTGWFGSKEQDVNVLGNQLKRKKGVFGGEDISGSTIFGDNVTTKKGIFGRRKTTVDVSGSAAALQSLFKKNGGSDVLSNLLHRTPAAAGNAAPQQSLNGQSQQSLPDDQSSVPATQF